MALCNESPFPQTSSFWFKVLADRIRSVIAENYTRDFFSSRLSSLPKKKSYIDARAVPDSSERFCILASSQGAPFDSHKYVLFRLVLQLKQSAPTLATSEHVSSFFDYRDLIIVQSVTRFQASLSQTVFRIQPHHWYPTYFIINWLQWMRGCHAAVA